MTISLSKAIAASDVRYADTSASEPDPIGIEVQSTEGDVVFDVMKEQNGRCTICFGPPPAQHSGWEIAVADFGEMLEICLGKIGPWETNLRASGVWSNVGVE